MESHLGERPSELSLPSVHRTLVILSVQGGSPKREDLQIFIDRNDPQPAGTELVSSSGRSESVCIWGFPPTDLRYRRSTPACDPLTEGGVCAESEAETRCDPD